MKVEVVVIEEKMDHYVLLLPFIQDRNSEQKFAVVYDARDVGDSIF